MKNETITDTLESPAETKTYTCGTLSYTKPALVILFFWLLWGDVWFVLMESVTGPIMLKKFEQLGASNTMVGWFLTIIPMIVYTISNPIISTRSDRTRTRWGRRLPYLLCFMPIIVVCLVSMAFGDKLGFWLYDKLNLMVVSKNTLALCILGVLLAFFSLFNTLGTTTFWYLFNDVVPEALIARFMSWFRVVGTLSASFYSFFIFPYSGTHSTQIFLGAAVVYLVGFGLMCLNVKEGTYPPPPPYKSRNNPIEVIGKYAKDCHSHRIYWYLWLCTVFNFFACASLVYDLYMKQSIGLDMVQIGIIGGIYNILVSVAIIGAGWLADRFHPVRVVLLAFYLSVFISIPLTLIWLYWHPAKAETWTIHMSFLQNIPYLGQYAQFTIQKAFLVSLGIYVALAAPIAALGGMWDPVMLMRTFPRTHYGQFCSNNVIWRSVGTIIGTMLVGMALDRLTVYVGKEQAYLYCPVWQLVFAIPSFIFFLMFYRSWKQLGGKDYKAPL